MRASFLHRFWWPIFPCSPPALTGCTILPQSKQGWAPARSFSNLPWGRSTWVSLAGTSWPSPGEASPLELLPSPVPSPVGSASLPEAVTRLNLPANSPAVIHSCSFIAPNDLDNENHLPVPLTMFGGDEVPARRGPPHRGAPAAGTGQEQGHRDQLGSYQSSRPAPRKRNGPSQSCTQNILPP